MTNDISTGAKYLLSGFKLIRRPRILPFVIVPILINICLFYFGINYLYETFGLWLNSFLDRIPEWLAFIKWLLWPLFAVLILLVVAYGFTFIANLIGSPFYGLMAEQAEIIINGKSTEIPLSLKSLLATAPKAILREIQKLLQYILWLIPIVFLSLLSLLITPLATLMPFIWFGFGAWMLSIQYVDYAYDNHQISFKTLKTDLKRQRNTALGFGAATTVASMIPLLNIIAIPAAVCGGTAFYLDKLASDKTNGTSVST